jgi:hypothetical protein
MTNYRKKVIAVKKYCFILGSKTTIYISLCLQKERASYRRSLQLSKEAIQRFKTFLKGRKSGVFVKFEH